MSVVLLLLGVNGLNRATCIGFCLWGIGIRWLLESGILEFTIAGSIANKAASIPQAEMAMGAAKILVSTMPWTSPNGIFLQFMPWKTTTLLEIETTSSNLKRSFQFQERFAPIKQ